MKSHSGASGKPARSRGSKSAKSKRNSAKVAGGRSPRRGAEAEVGELRHELHEAREQQTATSEVLQVISRFPGDVQPVFAALLEKAVRICDAKFGNILRYDGDALHLIASHNTPPAFVQARTGSAFRPSPNGPFHRSLKTKKVVHVADIAAEKNYIERRHPSIVAAVELGGVRTILFVPLLKGNELIGIFALQRQEVRPFTDKQIELVENFAAQAVIAIENARLLNELRQRTTDLTEALEQQTATSEVLQVISSSLGDLEPVFTAMLESAARICEAKFGTLFRFDGQFFSPAASIGTPVALVQFQKQRGPFQPDPERGNLNDRVWHTKQAVQTADYAAEPNAGPAAKLGGA